MKIDRRQAERSEQRLTAAVDKLDRALRRRAFLCGDAFSRADLAAASLLAPLRRPSRHGLDWPSSYPEPLQQLTDRLAPQLAWVDRLYTYHR